MCGGTTFRAILLASSAGFLSTLRGRASLTNAFRALTHFSNYTTATVAELQRGKELSLINLDAGPCESELGLGVWGARVRVVDGGNEG